jgi:hypothetical protein
VTGFSCEAAHYQSEGESLTINEAMWPAAGVEQEKRRVKDPWEDIVANMPEVVEKRIWDKDLEAYIATALHQIIIHVSDQERTSSNAILTHVLEIPVGRQTTADTMRLANIMRVLGWERPPNRKVTIGGRQVYGYFRQI